MEAVDEFLDRVRELTHSGVGTAETSHYTAIENLLRAIGAQMKPAVTPVAQVARGAAGQPDFPLVPDP